MTATGGGERRRGRRRGRRVGRVGRRDRGAAAGRGADVVGVARRDSAQRPCRPTRPAWRRRSQRSGGGGDAAAAATRAAGDALAASGGAARGARGTRGRRARALEWCAADIGSDDAVAAIAAAVGDRPVRMVVQAAGLPAAGPLATIEPDALGRAVALKCGGLLRLVRAVDAHLQPGARHRRARRALRHRARPVRLRGRGDERGAGQPRAPARDRLRARAASPRTWSRPAPRTPRGCGRSPGRRPRPAACPSTTCSPNAPPSRRSDGW